MVERVVELKCIVLVHTSYYCMLNDVDIESEML